MSEQIETPENSSRLPEGHPPVKKPKIGVLVLNLGTPDHYSYWPMRRYLSEFLSDKRVVDWPSVLWQPILQGIILSIRPQKSGAAYKEIWDHDLNESPLLTATRVQAEKIAKQLSKKHDDIIVEYGMRYGNPSTEKALHSLKEQGCQRILVFALYPQYSGPTTATAHDKVFDVLKKMKWQPALRTVNGWHDDPKYIKVLANSVKTALKKQKADPDMLLVSFHGVPKRYLMEGDPYHCLCQKTARLMREELNWPEEKFKVVFQSRFGPEQWLQPYADETVEELAKNGTKKIAMMSPAFVSDCLETLEEINIGLREDFLENGGEEFAYIPCLNDSKDHIDYLTQKIQQELAGWI